MNNFCSECPDKETLLDLFPETEVLQVNAHVHTPYSFSAFTDITQILEMAGREKISVVGINDFYVADGYEQFYNESLKAGIFPLFNIEFIGLLEEEQRDGIRINDPDNPGRCYFSGKGLDYPFRLDDLFSRKLIDTIATNQDQVRVMIDKANDWFAKIDAGIILSYDEIQKNYAKMLVRERHIARAIRMAVFDRFREDKERGRFLTTIFDGKEPRSAMNDIPGLENEIRGNLLKAGGIAFVKENENAFMKLDEVIEIIINAGGIPCYPVLLDDKNGNYTPYEKDPGQLWQELTKKNIGCIELIPVRNEAGELEKFVNFFYEKGFVILLGSEHNTPDLIPLTCDTRGKKPLSSEMQRISYEGCCVVAAHQYLHAKGMDGFLDAGGVPQMEAKESFIQLGNSVIHYYLNFFKKNL
jgi:hypothetical protein